MKFRFFYIIFGLLFLSCSGIYSNQITDTTRIYGVTTDAINSLSSQVTSLSNLHYKPTTRIVFDEWQPASGYVDAVNQIHNVSFVMGEILDSYYMSQYNIPQFIARVQEYLSTIDNVDIWEIGNEINGEWLGTTPDVLTKLMVALKLAYLQHKKTALTLYYNKNCWSNPDNEMFHWVNTYLPYKFKYYIDYIFISYYEDDCNGLQPNWQQVFDSLHVLFPQSKLGIGECGTKNAANKEAYMNRYYRMNITTPNYVGGYFWWYYRQDCVPYTKPLWTVINNAMIGNSLADKTMLNVPAGFGLSNYPNPFNPSTKIKFSVPQVIDAYMRPLQLVIYDILGREVTKLVDRNMQPGSYEVEWNASNYPSGIYIYKLTSGSYVETKKMVLVK